MLRRVVAVLLVVVIITGCSRTTAIPRDDLDKSKYRKEGVYRLRTTDGLTYIARTFTVTDTSFVITTLSPHSPVGSHEHLPIVIRHSDISTVEQVQGRRWPFFFLVVVGVGIVFWTLMIDDDDLGLTT